MDKEMWGALLRISILLPLLCALAYLTVRFGFSWTKRFPARGRKKRMKLLEQLSLGPKCGLSLVQVGTKYVLLAHQEGSVVVVQEMDELPETVETDPIPGPGLGQWMNNYWGSSGPKPGK